MGDSTGDGSDNETPVHSVTLDGFYLSTTLVTRNQWVTVTGYEAGSPAMGPDHPVTHITYDEILHFIARLSAKQTSPCLFSLPSEAQWEYAARETGNGCIYSGSNTPETVAWFGDNSGGHPHPVGLKQPNSLGLFDMSGNVWEWCLDVYSDDAYKTHPETNPIETGPGTDRVARGGSWLMDAWSIRCTRRVSFPEDVSGNGLGFRLTVLIR